MNITNTLKDIMDFVPSSQKWGDMMDDDIVIEDIEDNKWLTVNNHDKVPDNSPVNNSPVSSSRITKLKRNIKKNKDICTQWKNGKCKFSKEKCWYTHPEQ